jgi:cytochrome P450
MILDRRESLSKDPSLGSKGDLLSIMLQDPLFKDDDEQIINESITFFLAGTLTQATTVANALCYMIEKPDIDRRVRESLAKNFTTFID